MQRLHINTVGGNGRLLFILTTTASVFGRKWHSWHPVILSTPADEPH